MPCRQILAAFQVYLVVLPDPVRREGRPLVTRLRVDDREMAARLTQTMQQLSPGVAGRGKAVFFSNTASCSACHRVGGQGGTIGPDLSHIGQVRNRQDFVEAILFPSASIVNGYETCAVVTRQGRTHLGVIQRATATSIVLRNAQRAEIVVPRDDIEQLERVKTSIMPQGLHQTITAEQLSDLVAFLESLRE